MSYAKNTNAAYVAVDTMTPAIRERIDERIAIMLYDGNVPEDDVERLATESVMKAVEEERNGSL